LSARLALEIAMVIRTSRERDPRGAVGWAGEEAPQGAGRFATPAAADARGGPRHGAAPENAVVEGKNAWRLGAWDPRFGEGAVWPFSGLGPRFQDEAPHGGEGRTPPTDLLRGAFRCASRAGGVDAAGEGDRRVGQSDPPPRPCVERREDAAGGTGRREGASEQAGFPVSLDRRSPDRRALGLGYDPMDRFGVGAWGALTSPTTLQPS